MDTPYVQGADRLSARITTIRNRLGIALVTNEVSGLLLRRTLERFDNEVDPDGRPWKPLSEATLKRRGYSGDTGKKMLVRTKLLRDSIKIIKGGLGSTFSNTGAGSRIGIDASAREPQTGKLVSVYARLQNQHRRFLGVGSSDILDIDNLLSRRGNEAVS